MKIIFNKTKELLITFWNELKFDFDNFIQDLFEYGLIDRDPYYFIETREDQWLYSDAITMLKSCEKQVRVKFSKHELVLSLAFSKFQSDEIIDYYKDWRKDYTDYLNDYF